MESDSIYLIIKSKSVFMSIFQTSQGISETNKRQSGLFVDLHSLISNPQIPLQLH